MELANTSMRAPVGYICQMLVLISRQLKESPSLIILSNKFMNKLIESVFNTIIYHRSETPKM